MKIRKWAIVLGLVLLPVVGILSLFNFSYKEVAHPTVVLREGAIRKLEMEVRKTVEVSGNMHGPSNPFARSRVYEKSDWFYLDRTIGSTSASDIVFTHWRACPDSLWWQKEMRGSIAVSDTVVTIDLYMPRYDNGNPPPSRHVPWEHNGIYKVQKVDGPAVAINPTCGNG